MDALFTIGYEKADPQDFITTLQSMGVTTLVDIRERAVSRRKGFAKTALRENLLAAGIEYEHEKSLGSPSEIRYRLYDDGDYDKFFTAYESYLDGQMALINSLAKLPGRVALLCYERNPNECHRLSVAKRIEEAAGLEVQHLGVKAGIGRRPKTRANS